MRRAALTALLLCLALPNAAHADWGWTRWGMDADQVVKASKRAVKPVQGLPGQRVDGWELRAAGKVRQDRLKFAGEFFFDPDGKALHVVKLTPRFRDCPGLRKVLADRYGDPADQSIVIPSSKPIRITVLVWQDPAGGDFVGYSENPDIGELKAGCFVRYRPLADLAQPPA
jgi:hypothetical protein